MEKNVAGSSSRSFRSQENEEDNGQSASERQQRRKQTANILLNSTSDARILSFRTKAPAADEAHVNSLKVAAHHLLLIEAILKRTKLLKRALGAKLE